MNENTTITYATNNKSKEPLIIKMNDAVEVRPGYRIPVIKKKDLKDIDSEVMKAIKEANK